MQDNFDNLQIAIAQGTKSSKKLAKNVTLTWPAFCAKMSKPAYSLESHAEFFKFDKDKQDKLKNEAGWILGGEIEGKIRRNLGIKSRSVISIDCEKMPNVPVEHIKAVYESIKNKTNPICEYELFWHITRKHTEKNPRFRIFIPVKSPISPSKYNPVAQLVAQIIDKTGDSFDPVSYRKAQLMFLPTCSNGQKFMHGRNHGKLMNPKDILAGFDGDLAALPFSKGNIIPKMSNGAVENPYEKNGVIGAFNRIYAPISVAINKFVPKIYVPATGYSQEERFTYKPGESVNGVIVLDGGQFIYSHHGTDPCGGKLFNAFDMVRQLKFGHLDKNLKENIAYDEWPSFKRMLKFVRTIEEVNIESVADVVDFSAMAADESDNSDEKAVTKADFLLTKEAIAKKHEANIRAQDEWVKKNLKIDAHGQIAASLSNVVLITMHDPRLKDKLAFNKFTGRIVVRENIKTKIPTVPQITVKDKKNGDIWGNINDLTVQTILDWHGGKGQIGWGVSATKSQVKSAVMAAAAKLEFDPVIEYYESLVWDKIPRVSSLFTDYLGAPSDIYHIQAAELLICGAMLRSYNPGHKFDFAVILAGLTGTGKSTFIKNLFSQEWFGELTAQMTTSKDSLEQMLGKKCLELPELANMNRTSLDEVKGFLTRQYDDVRLTYAERMEEWPRMCVFMGTTNLDKYLTDPDGNRRFLPVKVCVDMIDNFKLARERDQIWAEGRVMVSKLVEKFGRFEDVVLDMTPEAKDLAKIMQSNVTQEHKSTPMLHHALKFLNKEDKISVITGQEIPSHEDHTAVRVTTSAFEVADGIKYNTQAQIKDNIPRQVAEALKLTTEWNQPENSNPVQYRGSKVRLYHREGSTPDERAVGYRIVRRAGEPEPTPN